MRKLDEATRVNIFILILGFVSLGFIMSLNRPQPEVCETKFEHNHLFTVKLETETQDSLTICEVEEFLKANNVEHHEIVLAQIILESGKLTSNLTKTNNNLLGMKYPRQRPTTALKEKNGFAYYQDWKHCIFDYMIWQSRYAKKLTEDEYFNKLSNDYARDESYVNKLKKLINGRKI